MQSILGKPIAERLLRQVAEAVRSANVVPRLATILVGSDPASLIYLGLKAKAAQSVGVSFEQHTLPMTATTDEVKTLIRELNARADVHGILVQMPLPLSIDTDSVIAAIRPAKDVDGFHPEIVTQFLAGKELVPPVFPRAVLTLLESTGVPLRGKRAYIFANSTLFAQVMTSTLAPSGIIVDDSFGHPVSEAEALIRTADIVISATGTPHLLKASMVRPGVIIIDGGITRVGDSVVGDVDPESFSSFEGYLTPVPGGVGPVTVALLITRVTEIAIG